MYTTVRRGRISRSGDRGISLLTCMNLLGLVSFSWIISGSLIVCSLSTTICYCKIINILFNLKIYIRLFKNNSHIQLVSITAKHVTDFLSTHLFHINTFNVPISQCIGFLLFVIFKQIKNRLWKMVWQRNNLEAFVLIATEKSILSKIKH